jgi:hypothetical protein
MLKREKGKAKRSAFKAGKTCLLVIVGRSNSVFIGAEEK